MPRDPRVTAYIQRSEPFARPILRHIRRVVHNACPTAEERIKWGFPHFDYEGKMMCSMAAFKAHAVLGFWYAARMKDPHGVMEKSGKNTAMGHFGRITKISDLPDQPTLRAYVKEAMLLNEGPAPTARPRPTAQTKTVRITIPSFFQAALKKVPKANAAFRSFPPGQKREYVNWLAEARTQETRDKRLQQALVWIAEWKYRNWKYMSRK